jgi:hypothetical protein
MAMEKSDRWKIRNWAITLISIFIILYAYSAFNPKAPSGGAIPSAPEALQDPIELARSKVFLDMLHLRKVGFGQSMEAGFIVTNNNDFAIKDIEISCDLMGKSGTRIGGVEHTIYDIVEARKNKRFLDVNMGLIDDQVDVASCMITGIRQ